MNIFNSLCYPKPDLDYIYKIYEFEVNLIESIINGKTKDSIRLYDAFFNDKETFDIIHNNNLENLKSYLISVSLLISHNVIRKGVSPYSAKSKFHAFAILIEKGSSQSEVIRIGKMMIQGYIEQLKYKTTSVSNIYIRKAIDYIYDHLGEDLTLETVANHVGLSKCYFCTQFKKDMKLSFTDYLTYARIQKSKYLLANTDKPILDIAILIGFNSQSYFTTQFKKYTGLSPKEFREKKAENYAIGIMRH